MRRKIILSLTLAVVATTANAAEQRVAVDRSRLDDPQYAAALYGEIADAARAACRAELGGSPLYQSQMRSCVKDAIARAVADVGAPELAAVAEMRLASN